MVLASVETKETLERWEFNVEYEFKPPSRSMTISDSLGTIQNVVNQLPYLPSRVMAIITSSFLLTREFGIIILCEKYGNMLSNITFRPEKG